MVLWDVSLDPAMNQAFSFWTYAVDGFYFGMPLSNWCGWTFITAVIILGYEWIRGDRAITEVQHVRTSLDATLADHLPDRRPDDGIAPFESEVLERRAGIYPGAKWWPVAIHVTWNADARPIALLTGGPGHAVDGAEHDRLRSHWHHLQEPRHDLLDGSESAPDQWSFSFTRAFFSRYL